MSYAYSTGYSTGASYAYSTVTGYSTGASYAYSAGYSTGASYMTATTAGRRRLLQGPDVDCRVQVECELQFVVSCPGGWDN
eukprot:274108-Rhodomonas_salina.1